MLSDLLWVDLGQGLVMRQATPADVDALEAFNARIHGEDPFDARAVASWTRDLMEKRHPTVGPNDFLLVERQDNQEIVSSVCLISQTWAYEGVPFGVGRPELVGTDPAYRGQGLVRQQFDVLHRWSRERGEQMQAITGIRYFYRQFGYEMGLEVGGGRAAYEAQIPPLPQGQDEPYHIRRATEADLPWIMHLYERGCRRSMISALRDRALFRNEMLDKRVDNVNRLEFHIIETLRGEPVGYLLHPGYCGKILPVSGYELVEGVSYLAVTPTVLRYLWKTGQELSRITGETLNSLRFWLGSAHPAYAGAAGRLVHEFPPYAYYVRVAELPRFIRTIRTVLDRRMADSACAGHSGEVKISFYRSGLHLVWDCGHLVAAKEWTPVPRDDEGSAGFPNLTFLQLLFGYRSFSELRYAYADCWAQEETRVILEALFPKRPSSVWGVS